MEKIEIKHCMREDKQIPKRVEDLVYTINKPFKTKKIWFYDYDIENNIETFTISVLINYDRYDIEMELKIDYNIDGNYDRLVRINIDNNVYYDDENDFYNTCLKLSLELMQLYGVAIYFSEPSLILKKNFKKK